MFSRRPDRPKEEPRFSTSAVPRATDPLGPPPATGAGTGAWTGTTAPTEPAAAPGMSPARSDATIVAAGDQLEGTLTSGQGVLVLGSFRGRIASETWVRMAEGSTVTADVTAQEIVVAGQYEGTLVARNRLEIASTGHLRGEVEAPRLQIHEGGIIDGSLSMTGREARAGRGTAETDRPRDGAGTVEAERGGATDARGAGTASRGGVGGPPGPAQELSPRSSSARSTPLGTPAVAVPSPREGAFPPRPGVGSAETPPSPAARGPQPAPGGPAPAPGSAVREARVPS